MPLSHLSCPSMSRRHTIYSCSSIRLNDNDTTTKASHVHRPPKMCIPKLVELFLRFKDKDKIFVDGSFEAVLSACAVPIKLKCEYLPPPKVGKDCKASLTTMRERSLLPSLIDKWKRTIRSRSHGIDASLPPSELIAVAGKRPSRAHVPLLCFVLRDRVCTTKIAKFVNHGGSPGHIRWACCRKGEGTICRGQINHGGRPTRASTSAISITGSGARSSAQTWPCRSFDG